MLRRSHENPVVQQLYDDFLEKPNSHKVGGAGRRPAAGSAWAWAQGRVGRHRRSSKVETAHFTIPTLCQHVSQPSLPSSPTCCPAVPAPLPQAHELLHTYYVPCGPEKYDITAPVVSTGECFLWRLWVPPCCPGAQTAAQGQFEVQAGVPAPRYILSASTQASIALVPRRVAGRRRPSLPARWRLSCRRTRLSTRFASPRSTTERVEQAAHA